MNEAITNYTPLISAICIGLFLGAALWAILFYIKYRTWRMKAKKYSDEALEICDRLPSTSVNLSRLNDLQKEIEYDFNNPFNS